MADTIKVDDQARAASQQFLTILHNQLPQTVQQFQKSADVLSNPAHWDGPKAVQFRADVWPKVSAEFKKMEQMLQELQQAVDKILTNITQAGS
jgi:uncharacterized protein YukE